jgi:hypothetical protein
MDKDFSALIFGKPLRHITLVDLQGYFNEAKTESDKLEFKSYPKSLGTGGIAEQEKKVLKTICAFLNSDGGLLIWGAPEGKNLAGTNEKVYEGALTFVSEPYEKDAFIAKIANRIIPSPRNVIFHRIDDQGKYLYLFEAPASEYAPHQFDNVYWMRMDGQSAAAPHHYIEALFRRVSFPKLEAYLRIDGYRFDNVNKHSRLSCSVFFRNLSRYQNGENLQCRLKTSMGLIVKENGNYIHLDGAIQRGSNEQKEVANSIYFGNFIQQSFDIILDRNQLHQNDYVLVFDVIFGAKNSPMKWCQYVIKVGPTFPEKRCNAIIHKVENMYFHEVDQYGPSEQEQLEQILNQ